jgi:two-component system, OmpR family, osmolarity sensor histidine kinase EnvZ
MGTHDLGQRVHAGHRHRVMLRSLFGRNFTLLVVMVLMAQLAAGLAFSAFIIRPQLDRATSIVADMVVNLSLTLEAVPADRRAEVVAQYARQKSVIILPDSAEPKGKGHRPRLLERAYLRMLSDRLEEQGPISWQMDANQRLWLRIRLADEKYWMALESPRLWTPITTLSLVIVITLIAAAIAGYLVQKRLSAPLEKVARAADSFDPQHPLEHLPEDGPTEVARLSASFNRMSDRLSAVEREREIMLAGISHDLRTPLAKLRLSIAMMDGEEPELLETCDRQVDTLDAMLSQFFDFARGFDDEPVAHVALLSLIANAVSRADSEDRVAVNCPADLFLPARPEALTRGICNLVRNAVVHGAQPVTIDALRMKDAVELRISDNGPGFPIDEEARITAPFTRGNAARSTAGTGLGLAIAKRAVAANGGSLSFERNGTFTAVLTIPVHI